MKIRGSAMAGLLAGLSAYSEAQLTVVETSVSYMSGGSLDMGAMEPMWMTGKESDPMNPGIELGDISEVNRYGSNSPQLCCEQTPTERNEGGVMVRPDTPELAPGSGFICACKS